MKSMLTLLLVLLLLPTAFAAVTIGDVSLSVDNAVERSNPREEGSRTALDDSAELKYVTFSFPITVTETAATISTIVPQLGGFNYPSMSGGVTDSDKYKVTAPGTLAVGTHTVSIQVLVPANLDAIDSNYNRVSFKVPVTFTTSDGTKTPTATFYAENNLELKKVTVESGDDSFKCSVEDDGSLDCDSDIEELIPGDSLTAAIEVENTFNSDADLDFTDVDINIDSDNRDVDPSDSSYTEDVDADDTAIINVDFDVDSSVEDGDDATITIESNIEDDNGARHGFSTDFRVEYQLSDYDVKVQSFMLNPASICAGETVRSEFTVVNQGNKDQSNVRGTLVSDSLGLNQVISAFRVEKSGDDDVIRKTADFAVKSSVKPGTYTVQLTVYYRDEDSTDATEFITSSLVVKNCNAETTTPVVTPPVKNDPVVVVNPSQNTAQPTTPVVISTGVKAVSSNDDSMTAILIVIAVVLVIGILALLVVAMRK